MFDFLPESVILTLNRVNLDTVSEIRLRIGQPLVLKILGEYVSVKYVNGYTLLKQDLISTLLRISDHSVYAHQETIKNGYILTKSGLRVGLCGSVVLGDDGVRYFSNITSMVISIPKRIYNIFDDIGKKVFSSGLKSILVISPCGGGKTTLLREISRYISTNLNKNVLVCDERNEISMGSDDFTTLYGIDVIQNANKNYVCYHAIKSLRPDIICLDEIIDFNDSSGVIFAKNSGVEIIASCHAKSLNDAKNKPEIAILLQNKIFNYAIIIDKNTFKQQLVNIYD